MTQCSADKPHLFLTGPVGIGKTTVIARTLALLPPLSLAGFRTVTLPSIELDALGEVYLAPVSGPLVCDRDHLVGIRWGAGGFSAFPSAFESSGCALLAAISADTQLLLMDELGFMEKDALRFCQMVLALLDAPLPILGVVKPKDTPLLAAVRAHRNTCVIEVTEANLTALPAALAEALLRHI